MEEKHTITLTLPFKPHYICFYRKGICDLCEIELKKDEHFDNQHCIHCKRNQKSIRFDFDQIAKEETC